MPLQEPGRQVVILKLCFFIGMCLLCSFPRRELSFGRGSTAPVGGGAFPAISVREPWDGKDGEVSPRGGGRVRAGLVIGVLFQPPLTLPVPVHVCCL